ncbi:hypothetical protein BDV09DRAFT_180329 [Aspergillus tetrazonus]
MLRAEEGKLRNSCRITRREIMMSKRLFRVPMATEDSSCALCQVYRHNQEVKREDALAGMTP